MPVPVGDSCILILSILTEIVKHAEVESAFSVARGCSRLLDLGTPLNFRQKIRKRHIRSFLHVQVDQNKGPGPTLNKPSTCNVLGRYVNDSVLRDDMHVAPKPLEHQA